MRLFLVCFLLISNSLFSQDSLEDILGPTSNEPKAITSTFSSTRIVNGHSVEMIPEGVGEFRISHRFGTIEEGFYDIFGLDNAQIRLGFDYGISDNVMVGFGRSSYNKTYDIFSKFSFLKQTTDNSVPVSLQYLFAASVETLRYGDKIPFMERFSQVNQALISKKMGKFSLQLSPTIIFHEFYNYEKNIFSSLGVSARYMVGQRVALTLEYYNRFHHQDDGSLAYKNVFEDNKNSLSLGIDIEAGGHVFQFHLSNSSPLHEKGFMFQTDKSWDKGQICFGFNILREFSGSKKSDEKW